MDFFLIKTIRRSEILKFMHDFNKCSHLFAMKARNKRQKIGAFFYFHENGTWMYSVQKSWRVICFFSFERGLIFGFTRLFITSVATFMINIFHLNVQAHDDKTDKKKSLLKDFFKFAIVCRNNENLHTLLLTFNMCAQGRSMNVRMPVMNHLWIIGTNRRHCQKMRSFLEVSIFSRF